MPQAAESPWEERPEPPELTYHVTLGEPSLSFELQLPTLKSLEDQRTIPLRREDESPGATARLYWGPASTAAVASVTP